MKVWIELDFPGLEILLLQRQKELGIPPQKLFSKLKPTWYRITTKGAEGIKFDTFCKICDCLNLDAVDLVKQKLESILKREKFFEISEKQDRTFTFFRSIMKGQ